MHTFHLLSLHMECTSLTQEPRLFKGWSLQVSKNAAILMSPPTERPPLTRPTQINHDLHHQTNRHSLSPYTFCKLHEDRGFICLKQNCTLQHWKQSGTWWVCNKDLLNEQTVPSIFMPKQIIIPHIVDYAISSWCPKCCLMRMIP